MLQRCTSGRLRSRPTPYLSSLHAPHDFPRSFFSHPVNQRLTHNQLHLSIPDTHAQLFMSPAECVPRFPCPYLICTTPRVFCQQVTDEVKQTQRTFSKRAVEVRCTNSHEILACAFTSMLGTSGPVVPSSTDLCRFIPNL